MKLKYEVVKGKLGWWIVGDPWCKFIGPYDKKNEAPEVIRGLKRFHRHYAKKGPYV